MLAATRLTVIVKAREACHLDAEVFLTSHRLHADDTALWHGLRISTLLRAVCIASKRFMVRALYLTIPTQPVLHRFLIQIIEGTTVHARGIVHGIIHLQDRSVGDGAVPAGYFTVIWITLGQLPIWLWLLYVFCSSGRLYCVIWLECVRDFGFAERNFFIFIIRVL